MVLQYLGPTFQLPLGVHSLRHWVGDQLPPKPSRLGFYQAKVGILWHGISAVLAWYPLQGHMAHPWDKRRKGGPKCNPK